MEEKRSADLRIQRTKKLLLDTMTDLLSEKPFDEVRVKDICERAGIHRSTFYDHFEDKYHLLTFGIQGLVDNLVVGMPTGAKPIPFRDAAYRVFKYFQDNKALYQRLFLDRRNAAAKEIFQEELNRSAIRQTKNHPAYPYPYDEVVVLCQLFTGGLLGVVSWWLANLDQVSLDQVTDYYTKFYILHAPFQPEQSAEDQ